MAVIDFPTSPINGQIFNAPNGVTYRWQSTPAPGLWLSGSGVASVSAGVTPPSSPAPNALWWNTDAVTGGGQLYVYYNDGNTSQWVPASTGSLPTTPGGDFNAVVTTLLSTSATLIIFPTVTSGNAGSWYSTSTGRYTPPAGRYHIWAQVNGGSSVSVTNMAVNLRKNGTNIAAANSTTGAANYSTNAVVEATVDANGTDYFDVTGSSNAGSNLAGYQSWFGAFPISGIKGPPGDPPTAGGGIIAEVTLASPANTIDVPVITARSIDITFYLTVATASSTVSLRGMVNSVPNFATAYFVRRMFGIGATISADAINSLSGILIGNSNAANALMVGKISFPNFGGGMNGIGSWWYQHTSGDLVITEMMTGPSGMNGFHFKCDVGTNFAAGSFVRVIGWP